MDAVRDRVTWQNGSSIVFSDLDDTLNDQAARIRAWNRALSPDERFVLFGECTEGSVDRRADQDVRVPPATTVIIPRVFGTPRNLVSALMVGE